MCNPSCLAAPIATYLSHAPAALSAATNSSFALWANVNSPYTVGGHANIARLYSIRTKLGEQNSTLFEWAPDFWMGVIHLECGPIREVPNSPLQETHPIDLNP